MSDKEAFIARGIESRIRQVARAIEGRAPARQPAKALWSLTNPLRERFPDLQSSLAAPSNLPRFNLNKDVVAEARREGFHIPPFDVRRAFREPEADLPLEGHRIVGIAESVSGSDIETNFGIWNEWEGAEPHHLMAFGASIADQALGLKPGMEHLPPLNLYPFGHVSPYPNHVFFEQGRAALVETYPHLDHQEARILAARILGHYQAENGVNLKDLLVMSNLEQDEFAAVLTRAAVSATVEVPTGIRQVVMRADIAETRGMIP